MIRVGFPTPSGRLPRQAWYAIAGFVLMAALTLPLLELGELEFGRAWHDSVEFLGHLLVAPSLAHLPKVLTAMGQTIAMAFVATVLTCVASLPVGILAAGNVGWPRTLPPLVRVIISVIRALPEVVWAILFVAALGLGPLPGILAMTVVGTGLLARLVAEAIEVVDPRCREGVAAHGASGFQTVWFALAPQALSEWVSAAVYMLDHNVRAASILGLVGAGGIGYQMTMATRLFEYDRLMLILLVMWLTIGAFDALSDHLRRRLTR